MRLSRAGKYTAGIVAGLLFIPLAIFLLVRLAPKPPVDKVEYARLTLSRAASSDAAIYSKQLYNGARALYDSAMISWQNENQRFTFFRNYDEVGRYAELSAKKAGQAIENSKVSVATLEVTIKQKIDSLNKLVKSINSVFKAYPLSSDLWKKISRGHMLLKESEIAYNKGQYVQAERKINDSEALLAGSYEKAYESLEEYFGSYSIWKKWVDKTIRDSRQNKSYSIIIDKFSKKCIVYLSGVRKYEYDIELGANWVGHKRIRGDKATPEGMYKITKKLNSNRTKYYKALLIDYPNDVDRAEFKKEIAKGSLPRTAKLGSLIEIHGNGGKGVDWTDGCVALSDPEMDVVYKAASVGTPVTIVGSILKLEEVLN